MATFTITAAQNIDALTSKAGGDTYNINGGTLTIDQDSRFGLNQGSTASLGNVTISATLGGTLEVDARNVILVRFENGSGLVPASNTVITADGGGSPNNGSGLLIGVSSSLSSAPVAAGGAMPATGYLKLKQWNGQAFPASAALSGLPVGTTVLNAAYPAYFPGWISLIGDEAALMTGARLGLQRFRGTWITTLSGQTTSLETTGTNATTWQLPTWGEAVYLPGVQVEVAAGVGLYEWYPNVGSQTALLANVGTESARGKVCWISSTGVLRFGHDGTNSTGGYVPPSGLKIRLPNIYMHSCTTAARGTTAVPNATLATRYEFAASGATIVMDTVSSSWYFNLNQAYSISMDRVAVNDTIVVGELATAAAWTQLCVGATQAQTNTALALSLNLAGGTISDSRFARYSLASSGNYVASFTDCDGWTLTNCDFRMLAATRGNATTGCIAATRLNNSTFTTCKLIGGRAYLTNCTNVTFNTPTYIDVPASTTPTGNPMYAVDTAGGGCSYIKLDGINFGNLTMVQPYSGLMQAGVGASNIKLRNIGSAGSPLSLGADRQSGVTWSRSTTTATVTKVGHGLKANDSVYVIVSSDTAAITVALKTVASAPSADTFTFTCLNAGAASGTLSYFPAVSGYIFVCAASAAANNVKVQRVYCDHTRTGPFSADNSSKNITYENVWAHPVSAPVTAELNAVVKGLLSTHPLTAQTNPVYGSHWLDYYTTAEETTPGSLNWTRSSTTATVTHTDHGLRTGDRILVTVSSDTAAIVLGVKSITVTTKDAYTFTCLNAGGSSGTLTRVLENGRIALLANEASAQTTAQITKNAGTGNFTAAGTLYMPTVNDEYTFTMAYYALGHNSFPIDEAVMAGGTLTNYDVTYQIDKNDGNGFSAYKNLSYPRAGGGGSNGSTNVTMTSTTGVNVDDYVFGTNIAPLAKVVSITNSTTIVVDKANVGAVSGILRFNQLPNETLTAANGVKLKIKVKTTTTNATAWSSLYVWTNSNATARANQYVLDTANLTLVGMPTGTDIVVLEAGTTTVLHQVDANPTSTYVWTYTGSPIVDIGFIKPGYVPFYYRSLYLTTTDSSIPVPLSQDRNYA